jgi:DNA modification methylase
MIPQIPSALLQYYLREGIISEGDTVYDPFSGSGTTAVEARIHGLHAEANDINPFACMLTETKAVPLDPVELNGAYRDLKGELAEELNEIRTAYQDGDDLGLELPEVRDGWFPEPQLHELTHLRDRINTVEKEHGAEVARFFRIALSKVTRLTSYQRNGEFKRYRIAEDDRDDHDPDVYDLFVRKAEENISLMTEFSNSVDHGLTTEIHYADSKYARDVEDDSVDIVITSPPYGDHGTTVAYGQFSQDPAIVAAERDYNEMRGVDKIGLGGRDSDLEELGELKEMSEVLAATLEVLHEKDGRVEDALNFFGDYYEVMRQVARVTKPGQPVAWVVANRTLSRVKIPTHLITQQLCEAIGYKHDETLPREIPQKTLPWENAPENMPGVKGEMMANENIVILKSPN